MFRVIVVILVSASKRFKNLVVGQFESPVPIGNVCSEIGNVESATSRVLVRR